MEDSVYKAVPKDLGDFFFRGFFYIIFNFAGSISEASIRRAGRGARRPIFDVKKPKNVKKLKMAGARSSRARTKPISYNSAAIRPSLRLLSHAVAIFCIRGITITQI